jgi:hypothetical protein
MRSVEIRHRLIDAVSHIAHTVDLFTRPIHMTGPGIGIAACRRCRPEGTCISADPNVQIGVDCSWRLLQRHDHLPRVSRSAAVQSTDIWRKKTVDSSRTRGLGAWCDVRTGWSRHRRVDEMGQKFIQSFAVVHWPTSCRPTGACHSTNCMSKHRRWNERWLYSGNICLATTPST